MKAPSLAVWTLALFCSACSGDAANSSARGPQSTDAPNAVPVETVRVRSALVPLTIGAYGTMSGGDNTRAALAFALPGRIARVAVSVGDRVKRGTLVAELERAPFIVDVAQARAALDAARAQETKATAGARPEIVAQTDAQIANARSQTAVATSALARQIALDRLGIASRAEVDAARAADASARAQLQTLEQQRVIEIKPWQPDIAAARAATEQSRAALLAAQGRLEQTQLTAPFAGTVVARYRNDGETADPTTPIVQIANGTTFTAQFTPSQAERIRRGDSATIEANGQQRAGRVVAVNSSQTADAQTVAVLIAVRADGPAFAAGAYGRATIRIGTRRALLVPAVSIVTDPTTGTIAVYRKEHERFTPVAIARATSSGAMTAVESANLHAGDTIAARGAYALAIPMQNPASDSDPK